MQSNETESYNNSSEHLSSADSSVFTEHAAYAPDTDNLPPLYDEKIFFSVEVGGIALMVNNAVRCEYVSQPRLSRLPLMPDWVRGVINVRGMLIPIFDIYNSFELNESGQHPLHVVIFDQGENTAGVCVDNLPGIVRCINEMKTDYASDLPDWLEPHVTGIYQINDRNYFEIDHIKFFESLHNH